MTGGASIATCQAVGAVYEFQVNLIGKHSIGLKSMHYKRYAHCSVYARERVFVFGGFAHNDVPEEPPQTLSCCEQLTNAQNYWETISSMNQARAFMSASAIQDQYVYLFGGIKDYHITNTIEKFDIITDTWISLYFKLPIPLSKHASVATNNKCIIIIGGMSADYEPSRKNWQLDLTLAKFKDLNDMKYERLFEGGDGAFRSANGNVFVMNGCLDDFECERYKPSKD